MLAWTGSLFLGSAKATVFHITFHLKTLDCKCWGWTLQCFFLLDGFLGTRCQVTYASLRFLEDYGLERRRVSKAPLIIPQARIIHLSVLCTPIAGRVKVPVFFPNAVLSFATAYSKVGSVLSLSILLRWQTGTLGFHIF